MPWPSEITIETPQIVDHGPNCQYILFYTTYNEQPFQSPRPYSLRAIAAGPPAAAMDLPGFPRTQLASQADSKDPAFGGKPAGAGLAFPHDDSTHVPSLVDEWRDLKHNVGRKIHM